MRELNFFSENMDKGDIDLFFGPLEPHDGPFVPMPHGWTMAHIMLQAGIFRSVTEARKNGWDKPIEKGFQTIEFKKRGIVLHIMNMVIE